MNHDQVQALITKMGNSVSDEVRQRALSTIVTKAKCKLLDLDDLCLSNPEFSATLLYWMQDFYQSQHLERAIWLLRELIQRESQLNRLRQNQAPTQFLCELREWMLENNRASEIVSELDQILKTIVDKDVSKLDTFKKTNNKSSPSKNTTTMLNESQKENVQSLMNTSVLTEKPQVVNMIQKPKLTKYDFVMLPKVQLLDSDEKVSFDIGVQLKYGNLHTLTSTLRDHATLVLKDFPIEIFKTRFEFIDSTISLLQHSEQNVSFYAHIIAKKIINKILKRIKLANDSSYHCTVNQQLVINRELRENMLISYPSLDPRYQNGDQQFKDQYIEESINQKTLKYIVEAICLGLLKGESQFPGLRFTIFCRVAILLEHVIQFAPEAGIDSVKIILKSLSQFFDKFETPIKEPVCNMLLIVAVDFFLLLPDEPIPELKRICFHLSQQHFNNTIDEEKSHKLLCKLTALNDTEQIVQHGRVEQIIKSIETHWDNREPLSRQIVILNEDELKFHLDLLQSIQTAIPMIKERQFLKSYVLLCFYSVQLQCYIQESVDLLINVLYVPSQESQIILYSFINSCLQDNQHLSQSKQNMKESSLKFFMIKLLQNEKFFTNLLQNSLRDEHIFKIFLEIMIQFATISKVPTFFLNFTQVLLSQGETKQNNMLLTIISNQISQSDMLAQLLNLFSKELATRQKATSVLCSQSYYSQMFTNYGQQFFIQQEWLSSGDYLQEFVEDDGTIIYSDTIDDSIKSIVLRRKTKQTLREEYDVEIEQLSNLESIVVSKELEMTLRVGAVDQLCSHYLNFAKDETAFARSLQIKTQQVRDYWSSVVESMIKLINQIYESSQTERNKHIALQAKILDLLSSFMIFSSGDDEIRQSMNCSFMVRQQSVLLQCSLFLLRNNSIPKHLRYSAIRFLYTSIFREFSATYPLIKCNSDNYLKITPIFDAGEIPIAQHWKLYYPLSSSAEWFVTRYIQSIEKGSKDLIKVDALSLNGQSSIIQQIDWAVALKDYLTTSLNQDKVRELITNPSFLGSNQMFIIKLIAQLPENPLNLLLKQVFHIYNETEGIEQLEVAALYMQICATAKIPLKQVFDLAYLFETYPFNLKAARLALKLIKKQLLTPSAKFIFILRQHCLSINEFQYKQSHMIKLFLEVTLGLDLSQDLQEVDHHILFNQYIQYVQSPIIKIRSLALNHLSNNLTSWTNEQQIRLADECVQILFSTDCQLVLSIALQTLRLQILIDHQNSKDELKHILLRKHIFSHAQTIFADNKCSFLIKSSMINLLNQMLTSWYKDCANLTISSNILQNISNNFALSLKKLSSIKQINEASLFINSVMQLYTILLQQSVSLSIQILQTYNVVDQISISLRKLSNFVRKNLKFSQFIVQEALSSVSQALQIASIMQADIVCIDAQKTKFSIFESFSILIQNAEFEIECKVQVCKAITTLIATGIQDFRSPTGDLICCLNQIFQEASEQDKIEIARAVGLIASKDNQAKLAALQTRLPEEISIQLSRELDVYIYNDSKSDVKLKKNKSMTQSFASSAGFSQNETIRVSVMFLKLLYVNVKSDSSQDWKTIGGTIALSIEILQKLLLLSVKYPIATEYFKAILINMATNLAIQTPFLQKVTENKQYLIIDLSKKLKEDTINNESFESFMRCLAAMGQNSEFRLIFYRVKIIEDMTEKLYKLWDKKKTWNPDSKVAQAITQFMVSLSFYKDAQPKLINSTKIMNLVVDLMRDHGPIYQICQDLLVMLVNCAIKQKGPLLSQEGIPVLILFLISSERAQPIIRLQASQLLLNLLYKSTQAITLFNRTEVVEELESVMKFAQRQADKYYLTQTTLNSEKAQLDELRRIFQGINNNINQILKVFKIKW